MGIDGVARDADRAGFKASEAAGFLFRRRSPVSAETDIETLSCRIVEDIVNAQRHPEAQPLCGYRKAITADEFTVTVKREIVSGSGPDPHQSVMES
ncbi:MAG: hypothetical protein A4E66_02742 [Syntrophus sp. PtaB.Bin001]|nr:MAG: hypothetical protein A4E66_02742 [Syntrophus sp. PtaB.Bin001]